MKTMTEKEKKLSELYKKYHNKIPVFFIKDIYRDKYVDLNEIE